MTNDLAALKAKLDAVSHTALQAAERDALRKVGSLFVAAIEEKAPERTEYDGGDLQPGELKTAFKSSVHIAADAAVVNKDDHSRVTIAPNKKVAHIARFVEDGHANRPGSKNPNTPAHPYVRPAFEATQQEAIDLYVSTMTAAIKEAFDNE